MKNNAHARNVDSKGRLTLGEAFANRTVLVEERGEGEVLIRLARVIPEREAWLYGTVPQGSCSAFPRVYTVNSPYPRP
jgi:hypothetical protein